MEIQTDNFVPPVCTFKHSVLVIDDSLDSLYLGRYVLEEHGFEVFTASTTDEAFRILKEIGEPNLVLLDLHLPEMSGITFLEMLDEQRPKFLSNVPVVFYSAVDKVPMSKAAGFIRKAGDTNQFLKQVHGFIRPH